MSKEREWGAKRAGMAAMVTGLALLLAACGSSGNATTPTSGTASTSPSGSDSGDLVAAAKANVDAWFAQTNEPAKTDGLIANNLKGKKILYLNAYLASPSGSEGLKALDQAQKVLGFELTTVDGQASPQQYTAGLQQAVAGNYDGVILYGIDCPGQEVPLKELKAAGIPVAAVSSVDCDAVDPAAEPLFTADVLYPLNDGTSGRALDYFTAIGRSQADYAIAKSEGNAKVILFEVADFYVSKSQADGFKQRLAECSTCTLLEDVNLPAAELGTPDMTQQVDQTLLKNPDATTVVVPYDDLLTYGVSNSIVQTGRADEITVVGGVGLEPVIELIRSGKGANAGYGYSYAWDHYAGVAALMSAIAGQPVPSVNMPIIWFDADHNLPASGAWVPGTDFKAAFEKVWLGQ